MTAGPRTVRTEPARAPRRAAARAGRCLVALGSAFTFTLALAVPMPAWALPAFDAVRAAHRPSDRVLLDRHGTPVQTLRVDATRRSGPWVALADVSPALREALLLSEDRRFWAHGGVDWRALAAGAWAAAWDTRTRGASTLTMQLAALLERDLARPRGGRSLTDKLAQMRAAEALEARWSKTQILEAYLNEVPLRGELVGVAAAADQLFGKHASGLDAIESAVLAALVRAPNADAAAVQRRACAILREQRRGCTALAITIGQAFARTPGPWRALGGEALAPHLARLVARSLAASGHPAPAAWPRSTLDAGVQRIALAALRRQLAELRGRAVDSGAAVVLDNASGDVLAWVGSAAAPLPGAAADDVDAVLARRQPGSTIKPFVYSLALERRLLTAASLIDDAPLELAAGAGLYQPANYDHAYRGAVSVRTALASSLNVPAVRVGAMLGIEPLFERLQALGLDLSESAGYHGYALALGSADVTLLGLTNAYRALARGGRTSPPRWLDSGRTSPPRWLDSGRTSPPRWLDSARTSPPRWLDSGRTGGSPPRPAGAAGEERQVIDPAAAWLVADILADPAARAAAFGLDSPLVTRGWAAVKTGTSKDMRDNWCLGFTARYTVGVWVGNAGGAPMRAVSGVSGAAPAWREIVSWLHAEAPARAPARPGGLHAEDGEWFLEGTSAPRPGFASRLGIDSPRAGSVFALDPDIPRTAQRLVFEGAAGRWFVDGRAVGAGTRVSWLPLPGRHVLERRDADGSERVDFEVRAAPPPRRPAAAPKRPKR